MRTYGFVPNPCAPDPHGGPGRRPPSPCTLVRKTPFGVPKPPRVRRVASPLPTPTPAGLRTLHRAKGTVPWNRPGEASAPHLDPHGQRLAALDWQSGSCAPQHPCAGLRPGRRSGDFMAAGSPLNPDPAAPENDRKSLEGGRCGEMAIYSLNHKPIGRSTHQPGTASAHIQYITRYRAASEVVA